MTRNERYTKALDWFRENMQAAETELQYRTPFQLLVAVVLSAQCTDKRVNLVTPALFGAYPTAEAMAQATPGDIFGYIRSVSYPHNKSNHLAGLARMLVSDYGGEVPQAHDDLVRLPGVGRKTANVVQSVAFSQSTMAVDTHVFRVSHRIGLVPDSCTTPYSVERELTRHIPQADIPKAHHWLLLHGRYVCQARKPKCDACGLNSCCRYAEKAKKAGKLSENAKNIVISRPK